MSFSQFDQGIRSTQIRKQQQVIAAQQRAAMILEKWNESERTLNILRTISPKDTKPTPEIIEAWHARLKR